MEMCYLGIFDWVFGQVMDHIFTPVFSFVSSLISAGLGYIFQYVLGPVVLPILQVAWDWYTKIMFFLYGALYYEILKFILSVVDYLEKAFGIFIGLEPVTYYPNGPGGGEVIQGSLLEVLFNMDAVRNAFWIITFSGVCIAVVLTIYGVAKSAFDLDFENKRPVSHVLSQLMKSVVGAFLIPFMVLCMIQVSTAVLTTLDNAVSLGSNGERSTMGSTLFVLSSVNAAWNQDYNLSHTELDQTDDGFGFKYVDYTNEDFDLLASPRDKFYINDPFDNYKNTLKVAVHFNFGGFDFTYWLIGIALIIIMLMCLFTFIRRLFEILLLYMVSPYFVAMMPLDDGEKFKQWFGLFMGKLFTGYGSVVVMKVYLLVLPLFMRGGIQFSDMGRESTFLMYGLVALGGAWAVSKSGNLLTSLVNEAAGRQEQEAMRGAMGMMMMAASPVINGVRSAAGQATGKMGLTSKQIAGKMGSAAGRSGAKGYQKTKSAGSSAKNKLRKGKLEMKAIAKHSGQRMMENKKISSAVNWGAKQGQKVKKAAAWTNQQRHRAADWGKLQQKKVKDWTFDKEQKAKNWASDQARQVRGSRLVTKMEKYGRNIQDSTAYLKTSAQHQIRESRVVRGAERFAKSADRTVEDLRFGRMKSPTLKDFGVSGEGSASQHESLKQFVDNRDQVLKSKGSRAREEYVYSYIRSRAEATGGTVQCSSKQREFYENQFRCRLNDSRYLTEDGGLSIGPSSGGKRSSQSKGDKT